MRYSPLIIVIPALAAGIFLTAARCAADMTPPYIVQERQYFTENDRSIRITSAGNVTGLEAPAGFEHLRNGVRPPREGYLIRYIDSTGTTREVFNFSDRISNTLDPSAGDIAPESFSAPATLSRYPLGTAVNAVSVVRTRDNQLRIQNDYLWTAGLSLKVTTTITNISGAPLTVLRFQRAADLNVSAGGAFGTHESKNSFIRTATGVIGADVRCLTALCPPPCDPTDPGCNPLYYVSELLVTMSGQPAPTSVLIKDVNSAAAAYALTGRVNNIDGLVMLEWTGSRPLKSNGSAASTKFETTYLPQ